MKFQCPVCKDGEGKANFTELSLERHLDRFHKRVDASGLTDKWVSNKLWEANNDKRRQGIPRPDSRES